MEPLPLQTLVNAPHAKWTCEATTGVRATITHHPEQDPAAPTVSLVLWHPAKSGFSVAHLTAPIALIVAERIATPQADTPTYENSDWEIGCDGTGVAVYAPEPKTAAGLILLDKHGTKKITIRNRTPIVRTIALPTYMCERLAIALYLNARDLLTEEDRCALAVLGWHEETSRCSHVISNHLLFETLTTDLNEMLANPDDATGEAEAA